MVIFSTFDFEGGKEASQSLLAKAIDLYNANFYPECEEDSGELLSRLELTEHGKPHIPGWMHFSISHSENCWAILIDDDPCGLDIQFPRNSRKTSIADRWFCEEDAKMVAEDEEAFWKIWTRREALIKAVAGAVIDETPSVVGDTVEYKEQEWYLSDAEIIGAEEIPYGAICTRYHVQTVDYYRI